jgi:hypothetical protein
MPIKEGIKVSGKITWRSHPAGTVDRLYELKEQSRIYKKRTFWQWLFRRPAAFSHFDEKKLSEIDNLIKSGKIEVQQNNLIVDSSNYGIDILVQYLISGFMGTNPFPLGIEWGEIGTGTTTPANTDTGLTTPTNRAPVSYAFDDSFTTASIQFFFPDAALANGSYYECGTFFGGTSTIGSGNMFNHALFATPYVKTSGVDSTLEVDISISN